MIKIQLALDRITRKECIQVLKETEKHIDIVEIGTGVIKEYGMSIIREIKTLFPDKPLVADMKTCDAGKHETTQAFDAGADISTVMAFSADKTITESLEVADTYKREIMVDLLGIREQDTTFNLQTLGVEFVSLHFGKDMQLVGELSQDIFNLIDATSQLKVAVAGGININSLPSVAIYNPDIIIVGGSITRANDRKKAASEMRGWVKNYERNH